MIRKITISELPTGIDSGKTGFYYLIPGKTPSALT